MIPTENGLAWAMEAQKASNVCPESVRPLRSVIVTEIIKGSSIERSENTSWIATMAAFAFNVSKMVSTIRMSTPPSTNPQTCSTYASFIASNVIARKVGSLTSGEIDKVLFVGPSAPATKRGRSGVCADHLLAARFATRAASRFNS